MQRKQQGFTLIELVIVIVILGVLSAFALPRFADLGTDARVATLDGASGSVRAAAAIARSQVLAQGLEVDADGDEINEIIMDGVTVTLSDEGYPTADAAGIGAAAQLEPSDFVIDTTTISLAEADGPDFVARADCNFTYEPATGRVTARVITGC